MGYFITIISELHRSAAIARSVKLRKLPRWTYSRNKETRNAYGILVWRSLGKRLLGRPTRRWEDYIRKMDLREVAYDCRM